MKIAKEWSIIGYMTAGGAAMYFGGGKCFAIVLVSCVFIDVTVWASSWKDFR